MLLQARCLAVGQTLMGFYLIPTSVDSPVGLVVNPQGIEQRSREARSPVTRRCACAPPLQPKDTV